MSKLLSVAAAVTAELSSPQNQKWPPNNLNKIMGADYNYNENTLALFLKGVGDRLKSGTPTYVFEFERDFVRACLTSPVAVLIGKIEGKTTLDASSVA